MKNILTYQLPNNSSGFVNILLEEGANTEVPYSLVISPGYSPLAAINQPGSITFGNWHPLTYGVFDKEFYDNWETIVVAQKDAYWEERKHLGALADVSDILQTLMGAISMVAGIEKSEVKPDENASFDDFALNFNPTLDLSAAPNPWCAMEVNILEEKEQIHFNIILGNYKGSESADDVAATILDIFEYGVSKIEPLVYY